MLEELMIRAIISLISMSIHGVISVVAMIIIQGLVYQLSNKKISLVNLFFKAVTYGM